MRKKWFAHVLFIAHTCSCQGETRGAMGEFEEEKDRDKKLGSLYYQEGQVPGWTLSRPGCEYWLCHL